MIQYTLLSGMMASFILTALPDPNQDFDNSAHALSCTVKRIELKCIEEMPQSTFAVLSPAP